MIYTTIYAIAKNRSSSTAIAFLDAVMPNRKASEDEYVFPQGSLSPKISSTLKDLLVFLEENQSEAYSLYFHNDNDTLPVNAFLIFCSDGSLLVGIDVSEQSASLWINKMVHIMNTELVFPCIEGLPLSREDFMTMLREAPKAWGKW